MFTCSACLASANAAARPFTFGTESRTIVQPRFPGGQEMSALTGGDGGGFGLVVAVVVGAVVATMVSFAELERSASQIAEPTPAAAATTRASSAGQIQSPGYQPSRRRHLDPRN